MKRYVDVSAGQATALIGLLLVTQSYLLAPSVMAEYAQQDMWVSVLLSILMTILLAAYTVWLTSRFPEYTLIQFAELLLGRFFGKCAGGIFFLYFITVTLINIQLVAQTFKLLFMPSTPFPIFVIMTLAIAYYCSFQGIGTLTRMSTILFMIAIVTVLSLIFSVPHEVRFINYLPLLQSRWSNIVHASLFTFAYTGQLVAFMMIHPIIKHQTQKHTTLTFIWGSFIACFLSGLQIIEFIGLFSAYQLQSFAFSASERDALVRIGEFFERSEIFFVTIWTGVMFVVIGFMFSISHNSLIQLFNRSDSYWSRIITVVLLFLLNQLFQGDFDRYLSFLHHTWVYLSLVCQAALPLLLGLIYLIKRRLP